MKRWLNFIIFVLFFIFISMNIFAEITGDTTITGETVTGEAIDKEFNLGIVITISVPSLTILNPENETYLINVSLLLNYTVNNEDSIWYNIDGGSNTTIISATYFNTSQGSHTLYLFANNSFGTTERNVSFVANSTRFTILYTEYNGTTRGDSTEFVNHTYEDLQNLGGIVLENTDWGKIEFNEAINSTNDSVPNDNLLDLDTNTNISNNRIELNSTALPNFNKSATLYLYNLTFSTPRILIDGSVCPITICTEINYSGNTLIFNVTQFTIYSAEETPTEGPTPSGGGGAIAKIDFSTNPESIEVKLKQGDSIEKNIIITNDGERDLNITIRSPNLENFIKISETNFILTKGETKTITLNIITKSDTIPDLYIGILVIESKELKKELVVAIEVVSKDILFDVGLEIPPKYLYIEAGENISATISIYNLGNTGGVNVELHTTILNSRGEKIIEESETVAVETKISFIRFFKLPEDIEDGRYVLYTRVIYDGKTASASAWFNIGKKPLFNIKNILFVVALVIILFLIIFIRREIKKLKETYGIDKYALKRGLFAKK